MQDDELQPHELEALKALPSVIDPGSLLEERTVRTLQARGLVHGRRTRFATSWWGWAAAAVAAGVIFVTGFSLGRSSETRPATGIAAETTSRINKETKRGDGGRVVHPNSTREVALTNTTDDSTLHSNTRYVVWF